MALDAPGDDSSSSPPSLLPCTVQTRRRRRNGSSSSSTSLVRRRRRCRGTTTTTSTRLIAPPTGVTTVIGFLMLVSICLLVSRKNESYYFHHRSSVATTDFESNTSGRTQFIFPGAVAVAATVAATTTTDDDTATTTTTKRRAFFFRGGEGTAATTRRKTKVKRVRSTRESINNEALSSQQQNPDATTSKSTMTLNQILLKAGKRGIGGGIPGAIAGIIQVMTLMWLRTIINYQARYGTTFRQAFITLFHDGGISRFYRGLSFALIQAPLSRFVSTAANDGVETLMSHLEMTKLWGPGRVTVVASVVVGLWRMVLMPVDTCKTVLQVDSTEGFRNLMRRVKAGKIGVLYQGAIANAIAAIVAHYPWFYTYNYLSKSYYIEQCISSTLVRNAFIGFISSIASDTVANCIRVVKTTKQTIGSKHAINYVETIRTILAADGWKGLFGRGLRTRILANAVQSIMFTVIWRSLAERWGTSHRHVDREMSEVVDEKVQNASTASVDGGDDNVGNIVKDVVGEDKVVDG